METHHQKPKINWYRSPISRDQLQALNQRSDFKGFLHAGGFLGLLALTGSAAYFSAGRLSWPLVVLLFLLHGTCWIFLRDGIHELVHNSVFKTKSLNEFFLHVFSFLTWFNPYPGWASHVEHHKYTLHPPDDLEVVLPLKYTLRWFLLSGFLLVDFLNPVGFWTMFRNTIMMACGKLQGQWEEALFAAADPKLRRRWFSWARIVLAGHATIILVSVMMRWWWLPVVITLAPFYGGWLYFLCNGTQHCGLQDNVPDFRLCCRTVTLNPLVSFLYWHMNYHTEHHMYAAVPCYNLKKLHAVIKADLPSCPQGLWKAWKQIRAILKLQRHDATYQYVPLLPTPVGQRPDEGYGEVEADKALASG